MTAPGPRWGNPAHLLVPVLLLAMAGWAQAPKPEPDAKSTAVPTVTFTLDWPVAKPPHYSISIESAGRATYTAVDETGDPAEPYTRNFTVTDATRERIFAAAKALDYFRGQFDFTKHRIAFTGRKTFSYADPDRRFQTTYNWSENAQLMDLTHLFQAIENTLDYGRKLEYLRRFDRMGLNAELKAMEEAAKDHYLAEVHAIEPLLRQIADDPNVMDLARQRARRLLILASAETASSSAH
ncbi:MAG: hypothetical protein LAN37_04865 [Acidobacteriia bacterium]|nr:hypothetical protein [Terriglobia bacterium]